jgi:cellobiose-specific phosphotransferase system component IIA
MEQEKWLTLSEVIHQTDFSESEARRLVKTFGEYLCARNFGDIIKYPPAAPKAIALIAKLHQQGWRTDDIMAALAANKQEEVGPLQDELTQEVRKLVHFHNISCQLLQATSEMVSDLVDGMEVLNARLVEAEEEVKNLRAENQSCRTLVARYKKILE